MIKNVPLFFSVPVAPSARRSYFPLLSSFSGRIFRPLPAPVVSDSEMIPLISFQTAIFSIFDLFNLRSFCPRLFGLFRPALLSYSLPWGRSVCLSKISVFFSPSLFPPFLFFLLYGSLPFRLRSGGFVRRRVPTSLPCLRLTARKRCNAGSIFIVIVSRAFVRIIQLFAQV